MDRPGESTLVPAKAGKGAVLGREEILGTINGDAAFLERYKIVGSLGTGATAEVFEAKDARDGREIAIKFLRVPSRADLRERFEQEARILSHLKHPSIVPVLDHGMVGKIPYMVMPVVKGATLRERLTRGAYTLEESIELVTKVLAALDEAHQNGIIHRDLKPENILIEESSGDPRVLDLGVAKSYRNDAGLTESDTVVGTPEYMSPEQCRGQPTSVHSDLYSVGVILFELLTGGVPFHGKSLKETLDAHMTQPVPRVSRFRTDLPEQWDQILARALAKVPSDRFTDARDFRLALERAREGRFALSKLRGQDLEKGSLVPMRGSLLSQAIGFSVLALFPGLAVYGLWIDLPSLATSAMTPFYSIFYTELPSRFRHVFEVRPEVQQVGWTFGAAALLTIPFLEPYYGTWELWVVLLLMQTVIFGAYQQLDAEDVANHQKYRRIHIMFLLAMVCVVFLDQLGGSLVMLGASLLLSLRALFTPARDTLALPLATATTIILLGRVDGDGGAATYVDRLKK